MKIDFQKMKATIKARPKISFIVCMFVILIGGFIAGQQFGKNQPINYLPPSTTSTTKEEKNSVVKENADTPISKNDAINIKLLKRDFVKSDYSENLYFEFQYTNNTKKTIKAFKGIVMFYDVFGEMLVSGNVEYLKPIKPGETVTDNGYYDYNPYIADNVKFKDQPDEDVSYKYTISEIIYMDEPEQVSADGNNSDAKIQ